LRLPEMRQLQQRIALRFSIGPLTPAETREYIYARLRIAGGRGSGIFTLRAIQRLTDYSRGIPRTPNILFEHHLVIGYADKKRRIGPDVVDEACAYLEEGLPRKRTLGRAKYLFGLARAARGLLVR